MALSYGLTTAGQTMELLYPLATGLAINGVITGDYAAILWLVACHALMLFFGMTSKLYDTRIFARMYAEFASDVTIAAHVEGKALR